MAGIFHRNDGNWQLATVATSPSVLRLAPLRVEPAAADCLPPDEGACLLVRVEGQGQWAVLIADNSAIRHNGAPVTGLRILEDRDALALAGAAPVFFTTEEPARVECFAGDVPASCPRCRKDVVAGERVVRCPSCGVVHHEAPPDGNCWSYADTCALCPHPTALDLGYLWTPEEL